MLILEIAAGIVLAVLVLAFLEYALVGAAVLLGGATVLVLALLAGAFPGTAAAVVVGLSLFALFTWINVRGQTTQLDAETETQAREPEQSSVAPDLETARREDVYATLFPQSPKPRDPDPETPLQGIRGLRR